MPFAIEATPRRALNCRMNTDSRPLSPGDQAQTLGEAVRALRERAGLTQAAAAALAGVTRQAWQNYEAGNRQAILRTDLQDELARALGVTRDDILAERDRRLGIAPTPPGRTVASPRLGAAYELAVLGSVRAGAQGPQVYDTGALETLVDVSWMFGPNARTLRVAGESMTGYAESGELIVYDLSKWPRRGEGCVVELTSGDLYVKEYLGSAQGVLKVRQRYPEEDLSFPLDQVRGVYTVRFRGG